MQHLPASIDCTRVHGSKPRGISRRSIHPPQERARFVQHKKGKRRGKEGAKKEYKPKVHDIQSPAILKQACRKLACYNAHQQEAGTHGARHIPSDVLALCARQCQSPKGPFLGYIKALISAQCHSSHGMHRNALVEAATTPTICRNTLLVHT